MNRKQRRAQKTQADQHTSSPHVWGKSYTIEEAKVLAIKEYGLGNIQAALNIFHLMIAKAPGHADAHYSCGLILQVMGRYEDALASYDKAIMLQPDFADAYNNRGAALKDMKRYEDALASYDKALRLKPDHAIAYNNRGDALRNLKRYQDALVSYDKALSLKPDFAEAYNDRGVTLKKMGRYEDALASYEKTMALNPDFPYLPGTLFDTKMRICNWQGINTIIQRLAEKIKAGQPASSPFFLLATPLSAAEQRTCAEIYVKNKFPPSVTPLWNGKKYAHDRIRIGYFSSDFRNHALSLLMAGLFELHDRSKFEVTAFSLGAPSDDAMRKRLEKTFEHFMDVHDQSEPEIAVLARRLEIDIIVDLNGFTEDLRTGIFAMRPAPVQVNYLGYPATMGADYIDYIIADAFVIPPQSRMHYSEKVVYLPDCFQATDDKRFINKEKPSRAKQGLPDEGFVFCSFNNTYKINPTFFDIWMRLLKAVPGSVLWLLGNEVVGRNLRAEAGNRGVDPSRLIFAPKVKYEEHLARMQCADLFLDTLPFNAGATASDALWAGVPLMTCAGRAFAARMAGSLLTAVGLPELITTNLDDYEALALDLATYPEKLSAIRRKLAENRAIYPLFNTKIFTKHFENALVRMQERTMAGLPPGDMYVS